MITSMFLHLTTPTICLILITIFFLVIERVSPGRQLPKVKGWYTRALSVNLAQLAITLATARIWIKLFGDHSLFELSNLQNPILEGIIGWTIGTFFFYWWHRCRHTKRLWYIFHQVHHSPSRIEVVTSFYKHPIEILSDSILTAIVLYPLLGCSMMGVFLEQFLCGCSRIFLSRQYQNTRMDSLSHSNA